MIERFLVLHCSGLVLFDFSFDAYATGKIDACLNEWIVKTIVENAKFKNDEFLFASITENTLNLVFLVVYQKAVSTQLAYVHDLLKVCRLRFVESFDQQLRQLDRTGQNWTASFDFAAEFKRLVAGFVERQRELDSQAKRPEHQHSGGGKKKKKGSDDDDSNVDGEAAAEQPVADRPAAKKPAHRPTPGGKGKKKQQQQQETKKPAATKAKRSWDDPHLADSSRRSKKTPSSSAPAAASSTSTVQIGKEDFNLTSWNEPDSDEEETADVDSLLARTEATQAAAAASRRGFFSRYLGTLTGRTIEAADLEPVMADFVGHLQSKNVAADVARELCESVASSLVGRNLPSFTRVESTVREALDQALLRILTPKRHIDILRDAKEKQGSGKPYVMVFCGVNGVGKSTSLAKIACWLKANGLRVLIVACDTFRSAAIEQLEIHANRLEIPLYQQGYGKSPATIAQSAIRKHKDSADVILIDTAGRMQDNEPLMKCLCTLIHLNEPDLVLFVGEALVGNDGVDQLTKFNEALCRLSRINSTVERSIDGIVLTKFDTIDDKVGAALSMVFMSGAPVVFLGTGQNYPDLKQMNPGAIVRSLLR